MLQVGSTVKSKLQDGQEAKRIVAKIGGSVDFPAYAGCVTAVGFNDGKFGVVVAEENNLPLEWIPDKEGPIAALNGMLTMPRLDAGKRPDVLYVWGKDAEGKFLAKLFFGNAAKHVERRPDELYRTFLDTFQRQKEARVKELA